MIAALNGPPVRAQDPVERPRTTGPGPAFDAAEVHISKPRPLRHMRGGSLRDGRFTIRDATMVDLIRTAWTIAPEKVAGGPSWLEMDRFDITAKAPANTPPETARLMLQNLLAERFALKTHSGTAPLSAYVLSVGQGKPKLRETLDPSDTGCHDRTPNVPSGAPPNIVFICRNLTMEQLAADLGVLARDYVLGAVVDRTALKGSYDFEMTWTHRYNLERAGSDAITIFDAIDQQLGLKLEQRPIPVPVLIVDSANRQPSPNPPGVERALPPPPSPEFEVATIRPSRPDATNEYYRSEHGIVSIENFTLKDVIRMTWEAYGDNLIANAPKVLDSAKYDIRAKAPPAPPGLETDHDDIRLMLEKLLEQRFHLKTHMEEREADGFVLTVIRPKLQKANPSSRTFCKEGPGPGEKDPRLTNPFLSRLIHCQNATMAQFAALLPGLDAGYVGQATVADETGLADGYDFTLSFSPSRSSNISYSIPSAPAPARPAETPNGLTASDPNGAIPLPDAIRRQIGLKLETKKLPTQVLVIDHIDEKPTDN
jgi:uncharacterized protein (TIGR03435 family)